MKLFLPFLFYFIHPFLYAQEISERREYVCYMRSGEINLDGLMDEPSWQAVPWSDSFVDIEGDEKPMPLYETRMKMIWDEEFLYIGVHLDEPHVWATYRERESVIFHENDIEVFLDPDGDTHNYFEQEINALGTEWDLLLTKPYRNGGHAINGWNINGFKKAIHIQGTLNNPEDVDRFWSIEMAIPWKALSLSGPSFRAPEDGEQWRINFSRVQWQIEPENGSYVKKIDPVTGKSFPEYNWVWSPMGLIDMHLPHRWGFVQFSTVRAGEGSVPFSPHPDEPVKDALRELYDLQRAYFQTNQTYASSLEELDSERVGLEGMKWEVSKTRFKISARSKVDDSLWHITEDSRVWKQ